MIYKLTQIPPCINSSSSLPLPQVAVNTASWRPSWRPVTLMRSLLWSWLTMVACGWVGVSRATWATSGARPTSSTSPTASVLVDTAVRSGSQMKSLRGPSPAIWNSSPTLRLSTIVSKVSAYPMFYTRLHFRQGAVPSGRASGYRAFSICMAHAW